MQVEGPHCFVCNKELKPLDLATIIIKGPNVGKFICLSHEKQDSKDIYAYATK